MKIVYRHVMPEELFPADVTRLVEICALAGYEISRADAVWAWEDFSDSMCAVWLIVDGYDPEYVVGEILNRCEEVTA